LVVCLVLSSGTIDPNPVTWTTQIIEVSLFKKKSSNSLADEISKLPSV
jgi:hypothetical protein